MPSFEHTDTEAESKKKSDYQPKKILDETAESPQPKLTPAPSPQPVESEAAKPKGGERTRPKVPPSTPTFIDAHLPNPGPSILQKPKSAPSSASQSKSSSLRGRNRGGATTQSSPQEYGEVTSTQLTESLSGQWVKDGSVVPPSTKTTPKTRPTAQPRGGQAESPSRPRPPRDAAQPPRNSTTHSKGEPMREKRSHPNQRRNPGEQRDQGRPERRDQGRPERRDQGRSSRPQQNRGPENPRHPRHKQPVESQPPKTLCAKIKAFFEGLFSKGLGAAPTPPASSKTNPKRGDGDAPRQRGPHSSGKPRRHRSSRNHPNQRNQSGRNRNRQDQKRSPQNNPRERSGTED